MASKFEVVFEGQQTFTIEADTVSFDEGVLAFYEEPDETRLSSSEDLIHAFSEWRSVRRLSD